MKLPVCLDCKHLVAEFDPAKGMCCAAYPEGIPDAIQWGDEGHDAPREGDHGIVFEPSDPPRMPRTRVVERSSRGSSSPIEVGKPRLPTGE
jgi:hypothetical protein